MTPLHIFRTAPVPAMSNLATALTLWTVWWLADQFEPSVMGHALGPVALAILAGSTLKMAINTSEYLKSDRTGKITPTVLGIGVFMGVMPPLMALFFQNDLIAQIGMTIILSITAVAWLGFATFDQEGLHRNSSRPDAPIEETVGLYTISGLGMAGLALISGFLIGLGDTTFWVLAMSIGALCYNYLVRWVAVLWLISREQPPQ